MNEYGKIAIALHVLEQVRHQIKCLGPTVYTTLEPQVIVRPFVSIPKVVLRAEFEDEE